jgi:hypothetical protein
LRRRGDRGSSSAWKTSGSRLSGNSRWSHQLKIGFGFMNAKALGLSENIKRCYFDRNFNFKFPGRCLYLSFSTYNECKVKKTQQHCYILLKVYKFGVTLQMFAMYEDGLQGSS